jgi:hypothetical protein
MVNRCQSRVPVAFANAAGVSAKDNVQAPEQAVVDSPVAANRMDETLGVGRNGADEDTSFRGVAIRDPAFTVDQYDAAQGTPSGGILQGDQLLGDLALSHFPTSVVLIGLLRTVLHDTGEIVCGRGTEKSVDILMQRALIALEPSDIIALVDDLRGDLGLTSNRADGHDTAFELEQFQQLWNELISLDFSSATSCPSTKHMKNVQRMLSAAPTTRATRRIAVNRYDLPVGDFGYHAHPTAKARLKRFRATPRDHRGNPIVRGKSCKLALESSLDFPNSSIAPQPSAPLSIAQTAVRRICNKEFRFLRSTRGS